VCMLDACVNGCLSILSSLPPELICDEFVCQQ
jgi:hypothetical protein